MRDPSFGQQVAAVSHLDVWGAGGGGGESGLSAGREKDVCEANQTERSIGRNGRQSMSVRS